MSILPTLTLSELSRQIQQVVQQSFADKSFWIIADVTNYTFKAERNFHYFDLVEKDGQSSGIVAKIAARAWGNAALNIANFERATGQKFKNDLHVLIQVEVLFNTVYGLQLNVLDLDVHFTLGHLEQQRMATLKRLVTENPSFIQFAGGRYQTRNQQLHLAPVVQRIAVISSETSAGYQDFRHTLENNAFNYHIHLDNYFAVVQGEVNAKAFLARLITVFQSGIAYDAVVLLRGGGAQTDFLLFDHYELNRAIAKFPIPVITGIGHQKNETIADLMAHTATKTPTKAAEFIIAHNRAFETGVIQLQQQLMIKTTQLLSAHKESLSYLNQQLIYSVNKLLLKEQKRMAQTVQRISSQPRHILLNRQKDLQRIGLDLRQGLQRVLTSQKKEVEHLAAVIRLMSPQSIMKRGFPMIKINGEIVKNTNNIKVGTVIDILWSDSELNATVNTKTVRDGKEYEI